MTEAAAHQLNHSLLSIPPDNDISFGFHLKDWKDFPDIDIPPEHLHETQNDRVKRIYEETIQRQDTTATAWHRFVILGRNIVSFDTFEVLWNNFDNDPLQLHLVIWYRYMYHVDHKLDAPQKLHDWANTLSLPYLSVHTDKVLPVDTIKVGFEVWSKRATNIYSWNKVIVTAKARKRIQTVRKASSLSKKLSIAPKTTDIFKQQLAFTTPPIPEEQDEEPMEVETPVPAPTTKIAKPPTRFFSTPVTQLNPQTNNPYSKPRAQDRDERKEDSNSNASSVDGKKSALIPNLNIPVNDGTIRISLRWKTTSDIVSLALSQKSNQLYTAIHSLLKDLFSDDDGLLYRWKDDGMENFNSISKMTPEEVRSYIAPTLSVLPSQSQIIVPLRFGFTDKPASYWKNQPRVQEALARHKVTAMFSNSKSTSGDPVISGYILLKAPRTTHRTRFLQSLRSKLPDTTPFFDIYFHRRTPFEQDINHLVVQCGKNHVHSLSQTLLSALDGSGAGVYVPRFAFAKMTSTEAIQLFEKHDSYIRSLRYVQLSPTINNLDTIRTEFFPDGTKMERTTRDWAASILSADGKESAHVDVVNGGYDQKSFLLMAPQHEATVRKAFEEYRRRVFPFSLREERFRDNIGPPPAVIHVFSKVNANLSSIDKLFSSTESWKQTTQSDQSDTEAESKADSSLTPGVAGECTAPTSNPSSNSGASQLPEYDNKAMNKQTMPRTPLDSLRDQYGLSSTVQTAASTDSNNSVNSRLSSMSTSTARFQEIEARIQRQQKEFDRKDRINAERLERMERQFTRFDDLEQRFDTMEGNIMNVMENQAGVGGTMNQLSDKISALMDMIAQVNIQTGHASATPTLRNLETTTEMTETLPALNQSFPLSEATDRQSDRVPFSSPIKKKHRAGSKRYDSEDISVMDEDDNNIEEFADCSLSRTVPNEEQTVIMSTRREPANLPLLTQAVRTPLPDDDHMESQSTLEELDEITTDLESRYNKHSSQGGGPVA